VGHTGSGDALAMDLKLSDGEHAFLQVERQPIGSKDGEECLRVLPMLLFCFVVHTIII
jgi:hypothetical protein